MPPSQEGLTLRHLTDKLQHGWASLWRCFQHTEQNSYAEKVVLITLIVFFAAVLGGIMFGFVTIETEAQRWIWRGMQGLLLLVFGRVWGKESERLRPGDGDGA